MSERTSSAMDVFGEAMQRGPAERDAFLAAACHGDDALRAEVEELIRTLAGAGDFLADPGRPGGTPTQVAPLSETPGAVIGRYKLLQQIGEGGFGVVFLAEQREPVIRRVALKIIKLGMDTRAVIARFEAERQALAMMDHPNIARVLDAGATETGRPYFVMELVRGVPITEYCDAHNLAIEDRLGLFQQVCHAVQHAHQKGIIHRDIKPTNVLVTSADGKAVPKVIDFGIAKATSARLTEKTLFTEHRQLIGTPEYMSPEQADTTAGDIDTRSDVYSLGVLLYELLTGVLPYDPQRLRAAAFGEIQRIIREEEPPKPSTRLSTLEGLPGIAAHRHIEPARLTRLVRGDLDWIVMKALEKDRTRRYETADGLALDVQRHLAREPVIAAPPGAAYKLRKFIRRNKGPVAAAAAVALTLLLGLTTSIIGFANATRNARTATAATATARHEATRATEEADRARKAERAAEQAAYVSHITAADASLRVNESDSVRASLDACPERLRNWEWRYLKAQSDTSLLVLGAQSLIVTSIAFSPDGTRIVGGSWDKTARIWDASSGTPLHVLRGHDGIIRAVAFSPDGSRVLTASDDHTARVWDAASATMTALLRGHANEVDSAEFSHDGARILTGSRDETARIWDARTGSELAVLSFREKKIAARITAHFSPDDARVVTTTTGQLAVVWDASTGQRLSVLRGHGSWVNDAVFSPDSRRIVTASEDATARVWDAQTGSQLLILTGHQSEIHGACFSPDGARILTRSWNQTRVWDAASGVQVSVLGGHDEWVLSARFAPDSARVLTASGDRTARLWDAATGVQLVVWRGHGDGVGVAEFSPDGSRIATASDDGTVRVWDAAMRPAILRDDAMIGLAVAFSPDSSRILTESSEAKRHARIWDATTGSPLALLGHTGKTTWAGFSPDGSRVLTTANGSNARVWDTVTGTLLLTLRGNEGIDFSASFSPDGTRIATAPADKTARIWDGATGTPLRTLAGHEDVVFRVSFSPDGSKVVTASDDKTARVWDAAVGTELVVLRGHASALLDASFSPDGARIVTASTDQTARIWDAAAGTTVAILSGHKGSVFTAAFSPDGTRIVTASKDRTARLWDAESGAQVAVLRGHQSLVYGAVFSADGERIATVGYDGTVRIWDTAPYTQRYRERRAAAAAEPVAHQVVDAALGQSRDYANAASIIRADTSLPDPIPRLAMNLLLIRADADRAALHQRAKVVIADVRSRLLFAADTRAAIEADTSLPADLHEECRRIAEALPRDRPDLLNRYAWAIVRAAGGTPESYAIALRGAEAAVREAPEFGNYVNTLGVSLYRNGRFAEALAALLRSDAINTTSGIGALPADAAFLAMTHFKLGHTDEARAALARLRDLIKDPKLAADPESHAFLREAESVVGAPGP